MFYQYNPHGENWGHMSWGHAVSRDLVRWEEKSPALLADAHEMVFSGSAVLDSMNTAGFGEKALVALYTAALSGDQPRQMQSLAYATAPDAAWQRYDGNPVLDLDMADFRDPFVFRHDPSESWVMIVVKSEEQIAQIYRSQDLKAWHLASEFAAGAAPGLVWECPTLVELPIAGTRQTRWLFKVDALRDAPGSGALYWTGSFDGYRFEADVNDWRTVDNGRDFYAAVAWNGPRDECGRPVWLGWMGNHAYQHDFPLRGWRGVISLPRRMDLKNACDELLLSQQVEPAVGKLFGPAQQLESSELPGACRIDLETGFSGSLYIGDEKGSYIAVASDGDQWGVKRRDQALPFLDCDSALVRRDGQGLSLWIDSETVECLTADGTGCASFQHRPSSSTLKIDCDQPNQVSVAALN